MAKKEVKKEENLKGKKDKKEKKESALKVVPDAVDSEKAQHIDDDKMNIVPMDGKEPHHDLRVKVLDAKAGMDSARWNLAECLFAINDNAAYSVWGYRNWEEYVNTEVGINVRTAQYLTSMYHYFTNELIEDVSGKELDDPDRIKALKERDEIIDEVKALGWSKGKSLIGVINRDNYKEWIDKAHNMPVGDLELAVKNELVSQQSGEKAEPVEPMKSMSFKGTVDMIEIWENALELAGGISGSDKRGNNLTLVMQDFIASNMGQDSDGSRIGSMYNKIASRFGHRIIAIDKETGNIVHNTKLLESLINEAFLQAQSEDVDDGDEDIDDDGNDLI